MLAVAALALFFALLIGLIVWAVLADRVRQTALRSTPLTAVSALGHEIPDSAPGQAASLRLTAKGRTLMSFVWVFGPLGIMLLGVIARAIARDRRWDGVVALLPFAILEVAVAAVALRVRRDYRLVRTGRLTHGKVLGSVARGGYYLTFYDFADGRGAVVRGRSVLDGRTPASPYWLTAPGSGAAVFYLQDEPEHNALALSLSWRVL